MRDWIEKLQEENIKLKKENEEPRIVLIDSRAEYLNTIDKNPGCSAWTFDELSGEDQSLLREQACESLKFEEPLLFIQYKEANKYIKELEDIYIKFVVATNLEPVSIETLKLQAQESLNNIKENCRK
jgi:hypothetical protein